MTIIIVKKVFLINFLVNKNLSRFSAGSFFELIYSHAFCLKGKWGKRALFRYSSISRLLGCLAVICAFRA